MSGSGALILDGPGKVTMLGTNTYTGGTTISSGTLVGDTNNLLGNITNNAQLTFDQATSGTFTGTISGAGTVVKSGARSLAIANDQTATGPIDIQLDNSVRLAGR